MRDPALLELKARDWRLQGPPAASASTYLAIEPGELVFCGCITWGCLASSQATDILELFAQQRNQVEHRGLASAKASVRVMQ